MLVYFADRELNILDVANTKLPKGYRILNDTKVEEVSNGVSSFSFSLYFNPDIRKQVVQMATVGNYVLVNRDGEVGTAKEFYTIITSETDTDANIIEVYCEDGGLDLLNEIVNAQYNPQWYFNLSYRAESGVTDYRMIKNAPTSDGANKWYAMQFRAPVYNHYVYSEYSDGKNSNDRYEFEYEYFDGARYYGVYSDYYASQSSDGDDYSWHAISGTPPENYTDAYTQGTLDWLQNRDLQWIVRGAEIPNANLSIKIARNYFVPNGGVRQGYVGYACTAVKFSRDVSASVKLSIDDIGTVYVNGESAASVELSNDYVTLNFHEGWNTVEVCWLDRSEVGQSNVYDGFIFTNPLSAIPGFQQMTCYPDRDDTIATTHPYYIGELTIAEYLEKPLYDTGFTIGTNGLSSEKKELEYTGTETAISRIANIVSDFGGEYNFSFDISDLKITGKHLNVYAENGIGSDTDIELRLGKEVQYIRKTESIEDLCTAVRPVGDVPDANGDSFGEQHTTIEGMTWTDPEGDLVITGSYLVSTSANQRWTRYAWEAHDPQDRGWIVHQLEIGTSDKTYLLAQAILYLRQHREPTVEYEISLAYRPEGLKIGDRVKVIDEYGEIFAKSRVTKIEHKEWNNEYKVTVSNSTTVKPTITDEIKALAAKLQAEIESRKKVYTWRAYADDENGIGICLTPVDENGNPKAYLGLAFDQASPSPDITDPSIYSWSKIKGDDGTSITITSQAIEYAAGESGTSAPENSWGEEIPELSEGQYLWTRTTVNYSDGTSTVSYGVSKQGADGEPAISYLLELSNSAIVVGTDSTVTPASIVLAGYTITGENPTKSPYAGTFKIVGINSDGTEDTVYNGGVNEQTYTFNYTENNYVSYRMELYEAGDYIYPSDTLAPSDTSYPENHGILLDSQTVPIIREAESGESTTIAWLGNEAHTFAGGTSSAIPANISVNVYGYYGATQQETIVGTITGLPTGMTATVVNNGSQNTSITIAVTENMTSLTGILAVPITCNGIIFNRTFSYSMTVEGVDGRGIASSTFQYYRSTSYQTQTGGEWTETQPEFADGTYIWTRYYIVYTDGTSEYSTPTLDKQFNDLYEQVTLNSANISQNTADINLRVTTETYNALKVGGRNLLLGTNGSDTESYLAYNYVRTNADATNAHDGFTLTMTLGEIHAVGTSSANSHYLWFLPDDIPTEYETTKLHGLRTNTNYTFSGFVKGTTTDEVVIFTKYYNGTSWVTGINTTIVDSSETLSDYTYFYVTDTIPEGSTGYCLGILDNDISGNTDIYLKDLKLEEGNKATSYSPAYEDIYGELSSIKGTVHSNTSDISALSDRIQSTVVEQLSTAQDDIEVLKSDWAQTTLTKAGFYVEDSENPNTVSRIDGSGLTVLDRNDKELFYAKVEGNVGKVYADSLTITTQQTMETTYDDNGTTKHMRSYQRDFYSAVHDEHGIGHYITGDD